MTSKQPYLLRALFDWITDNGLTPYLLVNADYNDETEVPSQYVEDGKIILNISPTAVQGLTLDDDWVSFRARFSGQQTSVYFPTPAVLAIYARENGKGMFFQAEEAEEAKNSDEETAPPPPPKRPPRRQKPALRLVK
ncbi:MAG: ClpXP protease specificity-enhancing factor [Pseudomonadota bacterium]